MDTEDVAGYLSAIDPATGQEKWRWRNEQPMCASVLAIAVPTGWGAWTEGFLPGMLGAPGGAALFAFALPE